MSTEPETPSLISSPAVTDPAPAVVDPAAPAVVDPAVDPAKPAEPAKVEAPAAAEPITLEGLKFPEGLSLDEAASKSFVELINDPNLSRAELAQKLVDLQATVAQTMSSAQEKTWVDAQASQVAEVRADAEIGGDKLAPALGQINQLVDRYGSQELRQVLDLTGAGNNIHVIKFLAKMANDLTEGGPVSGAPAVAEKSLANSLFPSMK